MFIACVYQEYSVHWESIAYDVGTLATFDGGVVIFSPHRVQALLSEISALIQRDNLNVLRRREILNNPDMWEIMDICVIRAKTILLSLAEPSVLPPRVHDAPV